MKASSLTHATVPTVILSLLLALFPNSLLFAEEAASSTEEVIETPIPIEETPSAAPAEGEAEEDPLAGEASSTEAGEEAIPEPAETGGGEASSTPEEVQLVPGDTGSSTEGATTGTSSTVATTNLELDTATTSEPSDTGTTGTSTFGMESEADFTPASSTSTSSPADEAASSTGEVKLESGEAVALANVLNLVNSNFVNSSGVVLFENFLDTLFEDYDIRGLYATPECSVTLCSSDDVHTNISNSAIIDNELYAEAITGRNTISGAGSGEIATGDAYAGVNLVNIVNTDVVDSNYILLTFNAFKDVNGDIVFPSLQTFFSNLKQSGSPASLHIDNTANVTNNVEVEASSGSNSASGSSTVSTGASVGSTNVFNQLNSSLVGGQNISLIFRVHGSWAGEIFGAPDNLAWMNDSHGGLYLFDKEGGDASAGTVHVNATNTAAINNNVRVVALTGENAISGTETALISTGNAYAGANIMNVANATVIGRNWIMAIINIFGDFNGNIAFGRPDLWVGGQVSVPSRVENGSKLTYTLTILNNGDSVASNVMLRDEYEPKYLSIEEASLPYTVDGSGRLLWQLPSLKPGEAVELTYTGVVQNAAYSTDIDSTLTVNAHEKDNNSEDNTDVVTVTTSARHHHGSTGGVKILPASTTTLANGSVSEDSIAVTRISSTTNVHITESDAATQTLHIENTTGSMLTGVVFHDFLLDPESRILHEEVWDIGTMLPHEIVEIEYELHFNKNAPTGLYALSTRMDWGSRTSSNERNGTILLWGNLAPKDPVAILMTPVLSLATEITAPADETFLEKFLPKRALAAETDIDIRNTHDDALTRKFSITGTLFLLSGFVLLFLWHRSNRLVESKKKIENTIED